MKNILFIPILLPLLLSAQPAIEWQKTYGGNDVDEANSIKQTTDGGYIVAGVTISSDIFGYHGGFDFWVLKLDNIGGIEWKRTLGGTDNETAYCIHQTLDGGYFVSGYSASNNFDVSGNHGDFDGWVVKLSSSGAIEWQKSFGGSGWDITWNSDITADNGYIIVGSARSSDGDVTQNQGLFDIWVVKLDESGNIQWQKTYGGSLDDQGRSIRQTADGGYIVVSSTASTDGDVTGNHGNVDLWVLKLSPSGAIEWQKPYGGLHADIPSDVILAADGSYVISGYTGSSSGDVVGHHGSFDYWVIKISSTGVLEWQKALGGNQPDRARNILHSGDGGYVVFGGSESSNGDLAGNTQGAEFWLVKLSAGGDIVWKAAYGGSVAEVGYGIANTSDNSFILSGLAWSVDGDITGSGNNGYSDFWVVKLKPESSVGIQEISNSTTGALEIYPNPASQSISLRAATESAVLRVSIFDLLGRELFQQEITNGGALDITGFAGGLYIIQALSDDGRGYVGRLVKE